MEEKYFYIAKEDLKKLAEEYSSHYLNEEYIRLSYDSFLCGAEAAEDALIKKACQWLEKHADGYTWYNEFEGESGMIEEFVDDFRKAMEG